MKKIDFSRIFGNNSSTSKKAAEKASKKRKGRNARLEELEGRELLDAAGGMMAAMVVNGQQDDQTPAYVYTPPTKEQGVTVHYGDGQTVQAANVAEAMMAAMMAVPQMTTQDDGIVDEMQTQAGPTAEEIAAAATKNDLDAVKRLINFGTPGTLSDANLEALRKAGVVTWVDAEGDEVGEITSAGVQDGWRVSAIDLSKIGGVGSGENNTGSGGGLNNIVLVLANNNMNFSGMAELKTLNLSGANLGGSFSTTTFLSVAGNANLTFLDLGSLTSLSTFKTLDLSGTEALDGTVGVTGAAIRYTKVAGFTGLEELNLAGAGLAHPNLLALLDVAGGLGSAHDATNSSNSAIKKLDLSDLKATQLTRAVLLPILSKFVVLEELTAERTQFGAALDTNKDTSVGIAGFLNLAWLTGAGRALKTVNLAGATGIDYLGFASVADV